MGSTRFPGKMLEILGTQPILEWVLRRTLKVRGLDGYVLATSRLSQDDVLVDLATNIGISVFRGSHDNVLERVIGAGDQVGAAAIVRVCADNPFVDPDLVTDLVDDYRKNWCDYLFNHRPGVGLNIADGFGSEIFDFSILKSIENEFREPRYREHLTTAYWEHPEKFSIRSLRPPADLAHSELRFDVDTPDDLRYLRQLVSKGNLTTDSPAQAIVSVAHAR